MSIVTIEQLELSAERELGWCDEGSGQLIVCMAGSLIVSADSHRWPMSARDMLWRPGGMACTVRATSDAGLCCVSFDRMSLARLDMAEVLSEAFVATASELVWLAVLAKLDAAASVEKKDILAQIVLIEMRSSRCEVVAE